MQLQFKNTHICFATASIWPDLNYKFKYMLNQVMTANPDDDFVQTIEVPEDILIQIFSAVTVEPEGVASAINHEMETSLFTQINAVSNLSDVMAGTAAPNEGARVLIAIDQIDRANKSVLESKITNGLNQILT